MVGFESRFIGGSIELSTSGAVLLYATDNHVPQSYSLNSTPNGVVRAYWEDDYLVVICDTNGGRVYYYYVSPDVRRYVQADRRQDGVAPREIADDLRRAREWRQNHDSNSSGSVIGNGVMGAGILGGIHAARKQRRDKLQNAINQALQESEEDKVLDELLFATPEDLSADEYKMYKKATELHKVAAQQMEVEKKRILEMPMPSKDNFITEYNNAMAMSKVFEFYPPEVMLIFCRASEKLKNVIENEFEDIDYSDEWKIRLNKLKEYGLRNFVGDEEIRTLLIGKSSETSQQVLSVEYQKEKYANVIRPAILAAIENDKKFCDTEIHRIQCMQDPQTAEETIKMISECNKMKRARAYKGKQLALKILMENGSNQEFWISELKKPFKLVAKEWKKRGERLLEIAQTQYSDDPVVIDYMKKCKIRKNIIWGVVLALLLSILSIILVAII